MVASIPPYGDGAGCDTETKCTESWILGSADVVPAPSADEPLRLLRDALHESTDEEPDGHACKASLRTLRRSEESPSRAAEQGRGDRPSALLDDGLDHGVADP